MNRLDGDLTQRDLSALRVEQMNPAERAELRRRYESFVRAFSRSPPTRRNAAGQPPAPRRWTPPKVR